MQVCFSKGLGAPVGSVLAGDRDVITRARHWRKRLGGGLRQAGVIAAPALIALTENTGRLALDHANAKLLAQGLSEIKGIEIDPASVDTNIVIFNVSGTGLSETEFIDRLKEEGVLCGGFGPELVRFVTHLHITEADVRATIDRVARMVRGIA